MARLVSLSGKVSHISRRRTTHDPARHGPGSDGLARGLFFRIDDRPARYRGDSAVGEGDFVTVAGLDDRGVLQVLAIRNRSTGVDYGGASALQYLSLGLTTLAGLLTMTVGGLGLLFLAVAGWIGSRVLRRLHALTIVRTAPPSRKPRRV